jgi:hypothetical protein
MSIGGFGYIFRGGKPHYFVRFISPAAEIMTHTSYNEANIESIVKALHEATLLKG